MAAIFNNSRWLPFMRSNIPANAPYYLQKILKFSKLFEFSYVRNAPPPPSCTLITIYRSCMWLTCVHTVPSTFQKIVAKKPSVNHIGSSDEPPINYMYTLCLHHFFKMAGHHLYSEECTDHMENVSMKSSLLVVSWDWDIWSIFRSWKKKMKLLQK